jgi:nucleoside-diphosphate-sugar epimerase
MRVDHAGVSEQGNRMAIGVVGATGLIGRHVVEALVASGLGPVVATYRMRPPHEVAGVTWVHCDLHDRAAALKALQTVETAVICAGQVSTSAVLQREPVASVLETLRVVTNTLEAAASLGLKRVILISSCTGYPAASGEFAEVDMDRGDPPSRWFGVGWMHRYLEKQLRWYVEHLGKIGSAVALRPTLVYGPYDDFRPDSAHFVPSLIRQVVERQRPIVVWGDGEQTRNLLHAVDLAAAVTKVLQPVSAPFEAFNVASPVEVSVNSVLGYLLEADGFFDADIEFDRPRAGHSEAARFSGARFISATGWAPRIGVEEGLAAVLSWYRQARR